MDPLTWAVVGGVASIAGAYIGGQANKEAANTYAQAQMNAAKVETDALTAARADANARYDKIAAEGSGGVDYLQRTVGESGDLTPLQQERLDEIRRQQTNQIRTSAIAGSGRTAASLFRDTSNDFINRSLEANRNRAFGAAGTLANARFGAERAAATDIPGYTTKIGGVQGTSLANIGSSNAASEIATGKLYGQAVGDIGSYIASAGRPSRFASAGTGSVPGGDTSRIDSGYYSYGAGGLNATG